MFPALFFPSQVYIVVPGVSVEAKQNGDDCWGIEILFLYHCIVGMGNPSAMQYNINVVPTLTMCGEFGGLIEIMGASVWQTYKTDTIMQ